MDSVPPPGKDALADQGAEAPPGKTAQVVRPPPSQLSPAGPVPPMPQGLAGQPPTPTAQQGPHPPKPLRRRR
eukprot:10568622-Alexandrium_andersonii.AAC.1